MAEEYYMSKSLLNVFNENVKHIEEKPDDNNKKYRTTRVNIDSRFRNINSKNITNTTISYLLNDPLSFTNGSNIITINHNNHNLSYENKIIIQGLQPIYISLTNGLTFFQNNAYVRVNHTNHGLNNGTNTRIRTNKNYV